MTRRPDAARRSHVLSYAAFGLIAVQLLLGCSSGDFGRQRYGLGVEDILSGHPAHTGTTPPSSLPLTDDERHLQALARGLLEESREQSILPAAWGDANGSPRSQSMASIETAYVGCLIAGPFRSAAARHAKLVDDTRNDITRLDPFFAVARRVADLDAKRERSLAHVPTLSSGDLTQAHRRMDKNMATIGDVHRVLQERAMIYRSALQHLVIALPSPMAVEAERVRLELERRLAGIEVFGSDRPGVRRNEAFPARPRAAISK